MSKEIGQRHYSPDQVVSPSRPDSLTKTKKLREGGSTSKFLESANRFCQDEIVVGEYRYKKSNQIGAGYSSRVYKGSGRDKQEYAIKVIDMRKFSSSGLQMLQNQIQILKNLNHPNVIKLYYVYRTQTHTYLVTELCKGGDLLQYMAKKGRFGEDNAAMIMNDVIEGLKYLMHMGVIHRDIKPANILRGQKIWKIADFGFSISGRQEVRTRQNVGTPLYMPIESLLKNMYSPESDIFAVGVMYYQLLVGVTPWQCRSEKQLIKKLATVPFGVPQKYKLSGGIKYLLNKMCSVDKSTRMQKQQFQELNLKNFANLNNFNDPMLVSSVKKQDGKRSVTNQSPANKIKRSKSKNGKALSKEKAKQKQYKSGRRKKSTDKVQLKHKRSVQKQHPSKQQNKQTQTKSTIPRDESSTFPNLSPQPSIQIDRFQIINQKILTNQLDYCRFMYYLIQNSRYIPLQQQSLQRIVMILFKHLMKLIKQLANTKQNNSFKLPHWDSFKQGNRCKILSTTFGEYCQKYQKDYLKYLKQANITVIKQINQKFSQLGSSQTLSISYYRKVQGLMMSALKDCLVHPQLYQGQGSKGYMQGVKNLMQYYRWIECQMKNYENYVMQRNLNLQVTKNYKSSQITLETFNQLAQQIKTM